MASLIRRTTGVNINDLPALRVDNDRLHTFRPICLNHNPRLAVIDIDTGIVCFASGVLFRGRDCLRQGQRESLQRGLFLGFAASRGQRRACPTQNGDAGKRNE
jgi:hypothetical protein